MNPMTMVDKHIIVTGAASGIGKCTAELLCELGGAHLLLLDRDEAGLKELQEELNDKVIIRTCDLTDFDALKEIMTSEKPNKGYHGLVHCAGIPSVVPLRALSNEAYEKVQRINTQAALNLTKIFSGKLMHDANSICSVVLVSSVYGVVGSASNVAYAVSKAGIIGMTKSLAIELAPKKIRVNCVAPGFIKTNMAEEVGSMFDVKYEERIKEMHPLGWGEAIDVANGIAFLLSDASKWTTGAVFNIDGGFTAQ